MSENAQKPRIRFKGFSDAWEQRKLNELVSYHSSNLTAADSCESGEYDLYDANTIIGKTNVEPISTDYITIIKDGAGVGRIRKMPAKTMFIGTMGGITAEKSNLSFIYSLLIRFNLGNEFTGSTIPHIYFKDYGNNEYYVPSISEQQVIGRYFDKIDELITLHQRKYDKLVAVKKSLLEKMFPADGETVPKIRFKGFSDAWEQRKLGDLFNYYRPDNYIVKSDKYVENAPTPVLTANKGFILGYTSENRTFSQPCIIFDDFTLDNKFVDFPFMVKSSAMKILVLKDEKFDDLIFCYELLNSTKIEVLGHARHYISVVQPTVVNIPRYEEQRRISELFQQISNLITLHQRQLEKLKNIKSALLEKMFV